MRAILPVLLITVATQACLQGHDNASAGTYTHNGREFKVPDGFTIEPIAGPPLVDRPIVADFDEKGRLYVADSSGSNEKVKIQVVERPHRVVRLEDTNGDGVFDRSTVFADKMMFPEGAMFFDGSLYVSAPPSIWKLTDTDDDGVADKREEWYLGKTLTGCANDLHGPYAGLDGWIYWCKGAFAEQTHERPGKSPLVSKASHIVRCRPDGTGLEPVMTGGMDNPVEIAFTPSGERIFTTTFFQHPGGGKRDGLVHAIYGGVYGKIHNVIDGHKRTGPDVMPVLTHLGPAAPSGLARLESAALGGDFQNSLLAANFNLRRITRHVLQPKGATFETVDSEFVTSTHQDFHPTDVLEDADGSVLVVDTGGWYKLCCPTSQIEKADVLGAIYRVKPIKGTSVQDPRGLKIDWKTLDVAALAKLLGDPRPAVQKRAIDSLAQKGDLALPVLRDVIAKKTSTAAEINAVWVATRIPSAAARQFVRDTLPNPKESVKQAAAQSASLLKDNEALSALLAQLLSKDAQTQRNAAEAIGRVGSKTAVGPVLDAIAKVDPADRVLLHSLTYALIEIADPEETAKGLAHASALARRAALIAIDQMDGGKLNAGQVAPSLASADPVDREIAAWIVGGHPQWAGALAGFFKERLSAKLDDKAERDELARQLARFGATAEVQQLLAERLADPSAPVETRAIVLQALAGSKLKEAPRPIAEAIVKALESDQLDLIPEAVKTARAVPPSKDEAAIYRKALLAAASNAKLADPVRLEALLGLPGGLVGTESPELLAYVQTQLDPDLAVANRSSAATVLAAAKLNGEQLGTVAQAIPTAGPLELEKLLTAFEQSKDAEVGRKLITALNASTGLGSLRVDRLKARLDLYGDAIKADAEKLYARLNADAGKQKSYIEALLADVSKGDMRRGQTVFNGAKGACRTCHAIGYVGGSVGPDLSRIGGIRAERDLLEAIVYPSVSFVRSYEPITLALKSGKVLNGILRNETSDELLLIIGANEEARIPRDEIEELRPGTVSVMPAGLDQQLSRQELIDLVAFLKSRQ